MLALFGVCALPVILSYLAYYVFPPSGRTNYGALVEPQVDVAGIPLRSVEGIPGPSSLDALRGRWVFVVPAPAACNDSCTERLFETRQVRLTTGKDRDRVERLWLVTDGGVPAPGLLADHEGLLVGRIAPDALARHFPAPAGDPAAHIYLVDPLGHLMMRFPIDADPNRMKKDISRLLKASRIG